MKSSEQCDRIDDAAGGWHSPTQFEERIPVVEDDGVDCGASASRAYAIPPAEIIPFPELELPERLEVLRGCARQPRSHTLQPQAPAAAEAMFRRAAAPWRAESFCGRAAASRNKTVPVPGPHPERVLC